MSQLHTDIAVIGAGIAGIATAYYLCRSQGVTSVSLIDCGQPMTLTSAQSGENYRNWWPHPTMTAFTDYSIDLLEQIDHDSDGRLNMSRRGYLLATRSEQADALIDDLYRGYGERADALLRVHSGRSAHSYQPALSAAWQDAPDGVDVLQGQSLIGQHLPGYDPEVRTLLHIRRAGDISGQQLGQYMLEQSRALGLRQIRATLSDITHGADFALQLQRDADGQTQTLHAERLVNAAGPFINDIAAMLGITLPVKHVLQQKIAFEDHAGVIPRDLPFSIDLDGQRIDWNDEERTLLAEDSALAWLTEDMPGGIHCRPDGGEHGRWIKLGWAYNSKPAMARRDPALDEYFPEIVLRGAARLQPALKAYYGRLPRQRSHYGGYYTLTDENWPLIGPLGVDDAWVVGALSGFGTMAACAAGALCAAMISGTDLPLPDYAKDLGLARYDDQALMSELAAQRSRGIL